MYCKMQFYLFVFEMCSPFLLAKAYRCCSYCKDLIFTNIKNYAALGTLWSVPCLPSAL